VAYYGVPLIAKGMLIGVLEILHRSALDPDDEWVDFLQVLAEQAAIAMDNIDLFDNLQSSNMNLLMAYDATIEGWARALELRDMETEGHSRRTVTLTMDLAAMLGIREEDMMHIRRGALLHDIGKMGVSDAILQKPGKLTDEEWQIMRQHPVYAYDWLSSIEYLRPALDIPYFHHEKWDGSGYPRGLKGEQIPLAARIFAVVDVWDALLSDRPYRNAWSKERTLTYIQEQAGQHFDPRVVDVFLKKVMIKSSIGVSQFPQAGDDMDTLTKLAEPAMYPEKTEKSKIKIFGTLVNPNGHR
jgi:HD-GYP domain-containing protein (c-di-GMP phosphodiesterase class II)